MASWSPLNIRLRRIYLEFLCVVIDQDAFLNSFLSPSLKTVQQIEHDQSLRIFAFPFSWNGRKIEEYHGKETREATSYCFVSVYQTVFAPLFSSFHTVRVHGSSRSTLSACLRRFHDGVVSLNG